MVDRLGTAERRQESNAALNLTSREVCPVLMFSPDMYVFIDPCSVDSELGLIFMASFVRKSRGAAQHVQGGALFCTSTRDCSHLGFKSIVCGLLLIYLTHFNCKCSFVSSLRLALHLTVTHFTLHYISLTVLNSKILHFTLHFKVLNESQQNSLKAPVLYYLMFPCAIDNNNFKRKAIYTT